MNILTTAAAVDLEPPVYYHPIAENSRRRWDQLEADAELAAPWRQLFSQVQSPRHVVSELLQNADDAGAKFASARIEDDTFVFEHDGLDFDEASFGSLCRFGYSNKRTLHTIGFRGIGFKSTFSLGDSVTVTSPSLSVRFERARFTEPVWVLTRGRSTLTRITVRISSPERQAELQKNLAEWNRSGASLLFFRSIDTLDMAGEQVSRRVMGAGPVIGSEWIDLGGSKTTRVLLIRSGDTDFPEEAVREIKQERNSGGEFTIPPCRVEVVLGLPNEQRLYVVLPTGVRPPLPFSCNAPFIQDPARFAIKDPSTSATNRWLLARAGRLAAEAMRSWLTNGDLNIADSVAAYGLLPPPLEEPDSLAEECAAQVTAQFEEVFDDERVLVTTENTLSIRARCNAPPPILYEIWSPAQIAELFDEAGADVLAQEVSSGFRSRLQAWNWLTVISEAAALLRLEDEPQPVRPSDEAKLVKLWAWVHRQTRFDYQGGKRRKLAIVPAATGERLHAADDLIRLPAKSDLLGPDELDLLASLVIGVDPKWLNYLSATRRRDGDKGADDGSQAAMQLLGDVGLAAASAGDKIVAQACRSLSSRKDKRLGDFVRLARIAASLDASVTSDFRYVSRDRKLRSPSDNLVLDARGDVEPLVPPHWADEHVLHDEYSANLDPKARARWSDWSRSPKSQLRGFAQLQGSTDSAWRGKLAVFLASRHVPLPTEYPYVNGTFEITDHDFDESLVEFWTAQAAADAKVWVRVLSLLLNAPTRTWSEGLEARVKQLGTTYKKSISCGPIPAAWIVRFRGLKCLPDNYGNPCEPAELLMRTPDTEPLLGVEQFVLDDLDRPEVKPLLSALGVRSAPADFDKLLGRLRSLATVSPMPLNEVSRWLAALDRLVVRADAAGVRLIREAFTEESLVPTSDEDWATLSEVYRSGGEESIPGLAVLHPAVADLPLWAALGLADKPNDDLIVAWFGDLTTGHAFNAAERSRVRGLLARCHSRVWTETGHWLSLDEKWTRVEELHFHIERRPDERVKALFPRFKADVADLSMLPRDSKHPALVTTIELHSAIEFRLADQSTPDPARGEARPWLTTLGRMLARVLLKDADQHARVTDAAHRLARTVFLHQPNLQVVPYVAQAPAGEAVAARALWTDVCLLVADAAAGRYTAPLVDELARSFNHPSVVETIRACVDRPAEWVEDYIQDNLELGAAAVTPTPSIPERQSDGPSAEPVHNVQDARANAPDAVACLDDGALIQRPSEPAVREENEEDDSDAGIVIDASDGSEERQETERRRSDSPGDLRHRPSSVNSRSDAPPRLSPGTRQVQSVSAVQALGGAALVKAFATQRKFQWDNLAGVYRRSDGHSIAPVSGPFQWDWRDKENNIVRRLWFAQQTLGKGVEVDSGVWEVVRANPNSTSVVVLGEDNTPRSIPGETLVRMVEEKTVIVFPSTYRLRNADP